MIDSLNQVTDTDPLQSGSESASNTEVLQEVQNKYESLQKRLSREFHEKYDHDRRRARSRDHSSQLDDHSTEERADQVERTERVEIDFSDPKLYSFLAEQNLSPGFKQKFQEWQKLKGGSSSIGSPVTSKSKGDLHIGAAPLKKSKSDWHKWRPGSKSESNVLRFLDKELGGGDAAAQHLEMVEGINSYGDLEDRSSYLARAAKKQSSGDPMKGAKDGGQPGEKKELAWLEKELQKVAREKQRLEKEKEKYAERETR